MKAEPSRKQGVKRVKGGESYVRVQVQVQVQVKVRLRTRHPLYIETSLSLYTRSQPEDVAEAQLLRITILVCCLQVIEGVTMAGSRRRVGWSRLE